MKSVINTFIKHKWWGFLCIFWLVFAFILVSINGWKHESPLMASVISILIGLALFGGSSSILTYPSSKQWKNGVVCILVFAAYSFVGILIYQIATKEFLTIQIIATALVNAIAIGVATCITVLSGGVSAYP